MQIGSSLTPDTTANIRAAVRDGLHYLGICAGGFVAGNYDPPYNGLNLTSGVRFGFYAAAASQGIRKTAVPIAFADGTTLDQY